MGVKEFIDEYTQIRSALNKDELKLRKLYDNITDDLIDALLEYDKNEEYIRSCEYCLDRLLDHFHSADLDRMKNSKIIDAADYRGILEARTTYAVNKYYEFIELRKFASNKYYFYLFIKMAVGLVESHFLDTIKSYCLNESDAEELLSCIQSECPCVTLLKQRRIDNAVLVYAILCHNHEVSSFDIHLVNNNEVVYRNTPELITLQNEMYTTVHYMDYIYINEYLKARIKEHSNWLMEGSDSRSRRFCMSSVFYYVADIYGYVRMSFFNFNNATLDNACFAGCRISHANFDNCSLNGCLFIGSTVTYSSFVNTLMNHTNFLGSKFIDCSLDNAELQFAHFVYSYIKNCTAKNAMFQYSDFSHSAMNNTDLSYADMSFVNAHSWITKDVILNNTVNNKIPSNVSFKGTQWPRNRLPTKIKDENFLQLVARRLQHQVLLKNRAQDTTKSNTSIKQISSPTPPDVESDESRIKDAVYEILGTLNNVQSIVANLELQNTPTEEVSLDIDSLLNEFDIYLRNRHVHKNFIGYKKAYMT